MTAACRQHGPPLTNQQRQVVDYFRQTHADYVRLWGAHRHLGLHCGYHDRRHRRHDQAVENMNRVLARFSGVAAGQHVLDAGCGIGGSAIWLARHAGARVTGVNISPLHLALAAGEVERRRLADRVTFRLADFCRTGLADQSFDLVWMLESACYAADKRALLAEAWRLLRPGGRLVVADGFLARDELTVRQQRLVRRWRDGWAVPNVVSVGWFARCLVDTGFHPVDFRDVTRHVIPSSRRIFALALAALLPSLALRALGLRSAVQTRGIISGLYQFAACRQGLGRYILFRADKQPDACMEPSRYRPT